MRFDLHIHSNHSQDCTLTVEEILNEALEKGLDGIAICDHDTTAGSYHAKMRVKELKLPLLVLSGMEVSTTRGHLLVLGIRDNIPPGLSPEDTIKIAKKMGGVVIAAHPFKGKGIGHIDGLDVDSVETFNSRCIFGENKKAKKMAETLGKGEVGGSDSHLLETIGYGITEIEAEPSEEAVLEAIRNGGTRSSGQTTSLKFIFILGMKSIIRKVQKFRKYYLQQAFSIMV